MNLEHKIKIEELISGDDLLNVYEWCDQLGYLKKNIFGVKEIISKKDKFNLNYWLKNKTNIEGEPDESIVNEIGVLGKIENPIVIDPDRDYCIEGRHRLAAALKYEIDCPVVSIILEDDSNESNE